MKALTIWQPWATLIVAGFKLYEFRRRSPRPSSVINQRVVIHAGQRVVDAADWRALIDDPGRLMGSTGLWDRGTLALARHFLVNMQTGAEQMPRGAALGTAILGTPQRCLDLFVDRMDPEDIDPDMWGWPLDQIEQWEQPVPAAGAQGFWDWDSSDTADTGHRCHAQGCDAPTPPRMLMCLRHWRLVPRAIQREVWRTYRPGQERDKRPTDDYLMAARHAIEAVADAERRTGATPGAAYDRDGPDPAPPHLRDL